MKQSMKDERPEITLEAMQLENVNDLELNRDTCSYISIPLKRTFENSIQYDIMLKNFYNKYVIECDEEDIPELPTKLNFVIDDQNYYLSTFVKIHTWYGDDEVCMTKCIQLSEVEQARANLVFLKFKNPDEYLRQYTRQQIANLPEIKNRFGFVMDEIDEKKLYKSVWITPDYKTCILGCVTMVNNPESKIQIIRMGQ